MVNYFDEFIPKKISILDLEKTILYIYYKYFKKKYKKEEKKNFYYYQSNH
jgi:hypothetical protein